MLCSYNKSQRDALFLKFILIKYSTCFGGPLSIIRSISTLYTRNRYLSCQFCWGLSDVSQHCIHAIGICHASSVGVYQVYLKTVYTQQVFVMLVLLASIRCISTLYTRNRYLSCQFCWRLSDVSQHCIHAIGICHASSVGVYQVYLNTVYTQYVFVMLVLLAPVSRRQQNDIFSRTL